MSPSLNIGLLKGQLSIAIQQFQSNVNQMDFLCFSQIFLLWQVIVFAKKILSVGKLHEFDKKAQVNTSSFQFSTVFAIRYKRMHLQNIANLTYQQLADGLVWRRLYDKSSDFSHQQSLKQ